jgi:cobalt-zinc-cadmium efflux system outer membrane protein
LTRVAEQEWQTRTEVRRAWLRWSAARLKAEQTERLLASIESLVASTGKLVEAGEIVRTEAALFTIEQASQRHALLRFRGEAAEAEQMLRSLLGLAPGAALELVPTVAFRVASEDMTPEAMADRNLLLARLRDEYEVAERTLRREVREQYPDLTIGPVADFDRGDTLLGFSLALPIPILNANRQGIAEAHAERDLARAAFETAYERLAGSLAATQARLTSIRAQREIIETDIAPMVDRLLNDAQNLLQIGEGGTLVLLDSLTRVGQTQLTLIDARLDESLALSELSHLSGPSRMATIAPATPHTTVEGEPAPAAHEGNTAREVNP